MESSESTLESARRRVGRIINHPITDIAVMFLIIASIAMLIAELAVEDMGLKAAIRFFNEAIIGVFIVELLLRYFAETKKRRFFRQYWIDILAVVPYLRILRVLRVFRLMRVFRFGIHWSRKMGWLNASLQREAVQWFAVVVLILVVVLFGAIGLQMTEEKFGSFTETVWWSVMSLVAGEPIGAVPSTTLGKLVALTVMGAGLTVFAMLTGVVSAVMIHRLGDVTTRAMDIDELENHIVICGWNRSGDFILHELQEDPLTSRKPVVLIAEFDEDPALPPDIDHDMVFVIRGDFTRLDILERARLEQATHAIVLADRTRERSDQDRDARSVLTAMLIERVKRDIFTSVELLNRDNESFLRTVGVDEIIVGTEYAASLIASGARNKGVMRVFEELLTASWGNQLYKVPISEDQAGQTWAELTASLKDEYDATVIGIERDTDDGLGQIELNPSNRRIMEAGERLLLIAKDRPKL